MAVQSTIHSVEHDGNGSSVHTYEVPFPFLDEAHIHVGITEPGDDEEEEVLSPAAYSVTRLQNGRGAVRLLTAYDETCKVRVFRRTPVLQEHVYQDAASFELALDRLTMCLQESGGGGGGAGGGPGFRSVEWAREVWGPSEPLVNGTRWAGNINRGGSLINVRLSVNDLGSTSPTVQITVGGQNLFTGAVTLTERTRALTNTTSPLPKVALLTVPDGAEVIVTLAGPASDVYNDWHGLQVEFAIEQA